MAHIELPQPLPGIVGLLVFRPETGKAISALTEAVLRGPSPLSRGERELIAAYVSGLNKCTFCVGVHGEMAACQLPNGRAVVDAVVAKQDLASVSPKMRALLEIAAACRTDGHLVTNDLVEAAREAGANDVEIHDTVLITALFVMSNRYVDGLAAFAPPPEAYPEFAKQLLEKGYAGFFD